MARMLLRCCALAALFLVASCNEPAARQSPPVGAPQQAEPPKPAEDRPVDTEAGAADCKTACDCPRPGQACHQGKCLYGTAATFCCGQCPADYPASAPCQKPDGTAGTCGEAAAP